jgi:chromosome partitioning protein
MRRMTVFNEKGGCCKTTLTVNIGAYLAVEKNFRVLLVDLDPQGQIGKSLGITTKNLEHTIFEILVDADVHTNKAIISSQFENLFLLPADKRLTDFSVNVANDNDRYLKLFKKIKMIEDDYDFIFFDAPPSISLITINIMMAANEIIIPVSLTYFGMDGCAEVLQTVKLLKDNFNKFDLEIIAVVPTLYRNTKLANSILKRLQEKFGSLLIKTILKYNVKIDESQSHGTTIFKYAPRSVGAVMIKKISEEVLKRG